MKLETAAAEQAKNRVAFFEKLGIRPSHLIIPIQSHSSLVKTVHLRDASKAIPHADALTTPSKRLFLTVTVADCFPVYFYNPKTNALGLAHCGWKGIIGGLALKTLKALNSPVAETLVGIGPGIQKCHFEIKPDILPKFANYHDAVIYRGKKIYVDLPKILKQQLMSAGVLKNNIEISKSCTYHLKNKYFSARRDKQATLKAMIAYIGRV